MTLLEAAEEARQFLVILSHYDHMKRQYPETARKCANHADALDEAIRNNVK